MPQTGLCVRKVRLGYTGLRLKTYVYHHPYRASDLTNEATLSSGSILGTVREGSDWCLDPLQASAAT